MSVLTKFFVAIAAALRWIWHGPPRGPKPPVDAKTDMAVEPAPVAPAAKPGGVAAADSNLGVFHDKQRNREIPFRLYAPARASGPAPVVLFSHGLGGSRDAAPYLGEALARAGYFAFFLQHAGSDESLIDDAANQDEAFSRLRLAMQNGGAAVDRFRDIPVVLDHLMQIGPKSQLAGRLDMTRVGFAGHSFGARGVMTAAGQSVGQHGARFKDRRVRAGVLLSPSLPSGPVTARAYDEVDIPLLHVTGTQDGVPLQGDSFDPATRTKPFELINAPEQYLLVLDGATHSSLVGFSSLLGERAQLSSADLDAVKTSVATATVLFFDAYLKRDPKARQKLRREFRLGLKPGDKFLIK